MFGMTSNDTSLVLFVALIVFGYVGVAFANALKAKYEPKDEDEEEDDDETLSEIKALLEKQNELLDEQNDLLCEIRDVNTKPETKDSKPGDSSTPTEQQNL